MTQISKLKPSELIRVAIQDLRAVERVKGTYEVEMDNNFFVPPGTNAWGRGSDKCQVCFAGAVMAKTLGCDPTTMASPTDFDTKTRDALYALDNFRNGDIESGLDHLHIKHPFGLVKEIEVMSYTEDPRRFKKQMLQLADTFEKLGI